MTRKCSYCDQMTKGVICQRCNQKLKTLRVKLKIVNALGNECKQCGLKCHFENLCCFDAHHVGEKTFNLSDAHKHTWVNVQKEIKNCELLRAICHRLNHQTKYPQGMIEQAIESAKKFNYM